MKSKSVHRSLFASIILGICLLTSSCSYIVKFVVVNETNSPIEIEYTMTLENYIRSPDQVGPPNAMIPARLDLTKWEDYFQLGDWEEKPSAVQNFAPTTGRFVVRIMPREAMRILSASDRVYAEDGHKYFPLLTLEIRGKNGTMSLTGLELFRQFLGRDYSHRFVTYK